MNRKYISKSWFSFNTIREWWVHKRFGNEPRQSTNWRCPMQWTQWNDQWSEFDRLRAESIRRSQASNWNTIKATLRGLHPPGCQAYSVVRLAPAKLQWSTNGCQARGWEGRLVPERQGSSELRSTIVAFRVLNQWWKDVSWGIWNNRTIIENVNFSLAKIQV